MDRLLLDGIYVNPLSHPFSLSLHLRPWKIAGSIKIPGIRMNAIRGFAHAPAAKRLERRVMGFS
jgi:hypothetical protein